MIDSAVKVSGSPSIDALVDAFNGARWEELLELSRAAVVLNPSWGFASKAAAIASWRMTRWSLAKAFFTRATTIDATDHAAWTGLAVVLAEESGVAGAFDCFSRGIILGIEIVSAYSDFAMALIKGQRTFEAREKLKVAVLLDVDNDEAWFQLGNIASESGGLQEAIRFLELAVSLNPSDARYLGGLAVALRRVRNLDKSLIFHLRALAVNSHSASHLADVGFFYIAQEQSRQALSSFSRALCLEPGFSLALNGFSVTVRDAGFVEKSLRQSQRSLVIKPDDAVALDCIGTSLKKNNSINNSLRFYEAAISALPCFSEAWVNRGVVLFESGRVAEALVSYDRASLSDRLNASASWNKSLAYLALGNFASGWPLYEERFAAGYAALGAVSQLPRFSPKTRGVSRTLVTAEQGLGDQIMFCTLISEFSRRYGPLVVEVDPRLLALFRRSMTDTISITEIRTKDRADLCCSQISMGSLPLYVGAKNGAFSESSSGYLRADRRRVELYRQTLHRSDNDFVVGVSWRSTSQISGPNRNVPLRTLCEVLRVHHPRVRIVSLQYGDVDDEILTASTVAGGLVRYPGVNLTNDLDQVAALIHACDAVISIGNTVAHLAGALGKRAAVLLPYKNPSWRWMLKGAQSPWYSSLKLYRKKNLQSDWLEVIHAAVTEL